MQFNGLIYGFHQMFCRTFWVGFASLVVFFLSAPVTVLAAKKQIKECEVALARKGEKSPELKRALADLRKGKYSSRYGSWTLAATVRSYDIKNENERFALAMAIAKNRGQAGGVAQYIDRFDLEDPEYFYRLALAMARHNPYEVSENITKFKIKNVDRLFEIAKACAYDNGMQISENIKNFKFDSEHMRFEIAKAAAKSKSQGWEVLVHIKNYQITNQDWLKEIVMLVVKANAMTVGAYLVDVGLTRESDRIDVARAIIKNNGIISRRVQNFKISDPRIRLDLAFAEATLRGDQVAHNVGNFQLPNEGDRFELAKKIFIKRRSSIKLNDSRQTNYINGFDETSLPNFDLSPEHEREIIGEAILTEPLRVITAIENTHIEGIQDLDNPAAEVDLKRVLARFSTRHPTLLPRKWINAIFDRSKNREVIYSLITEAYRAKSRDRSADFSDSLEIVSKAAGLDLSALRADTYSEKSVAQLYELLLDLQKTVSSPSFHGLRFDQSVFGDRRLTSLLKVLLRARDLLYLSDNSNAGWLKIRREYFEKSESRALRVEDLDAITAQLKPEILNRILSLFRKSKLSLTFEQFEALSDAWGGLDPIMTLVARFNGNQYWGGEVPVLAEVFQKALNGRFFEYKFLDDSAASQLEVLKSEAAREGWMRPRVLVGMGQKNTELNALSTAPDLESLRSMIEHNLLVHTRYSEIESSVEVPVLELRDPGLSVQQWLLAYDSRSIAKSLLKAVASETEPSRIAIYASALKMLSRKDATWIAPDQVTQVQQDLDAIVKLARPAKRNSISGGELAVTVVSSDPKLLLTVGDLVQTSSCQNYRTGSHIETLLGYVIDANVQAMATFAVGQSHFESFGDYRAVYDAYAKGLAVQTSFDGNRKILTFEIPGDAGAVQRVVSRPLDYAYLRQMVKLGAGARGKPAVVAESEYVQDHSLLPQMRAQHRAMLDQIASEIGGKVGGTIRISESRNPGGVYSDLGGGIKTSAYEIRVRKK